MYISHKLLLIYKVFKYHHIYHCIRHTLTEGTLLSYKDILWEKNMFASLCITKRHFEVVLLEKMYDSVKVNTKYYDGRWGC